MIRGRWSDFALALCAAAVIGVAALVLLALRPAAGPRALVAGHRQPDLSVRRHIGPTLRDLLANFAALRRPATAAEHAAVATFTAQTSVQPEVPEYVRLLGRVESQPVYLVVYPIFRHGARGAVVAHEMAIDGGGDRGGLGGYTYVPGNYMIFPATDAPPDGPTAFVGVVPDGVHSVRWQFACINGRHTSLSGCQLPYPRVADVPVHDNLAVLRTNENDWHSGYSRSYTGVTRVTWYGPAGMTKVFTNANTAVPFPGAPAWRR